MKDQWLAMEHYRMHAVEEWPDGPRKRAALAAIHSKLESLSGSGQSSSLIPCAVCQDRTRNLVEFPYPRPASLPVPVAA